jgi:hypothetical protein
MKRITLGLAITALAALCLSGASALAGTTKASTGPAPQATWSDSGWTWTHTDIAGHVLWTRSGTAAERPAFGSGAPDGVATADAEPSLEAPASASGCNAVDETMTWRSLISTLAVFHHRVYWCWSYPRITGVNVSCYSTSVDQLVVDLGCGGSGNYYRWSGSPQGGHYSFRQGSYRNCIPRVGCIATAQPWIKIWVNGNGAWTTQKGW